MLTWTSQVLPKPKFRNLRARGGQDSQRDAGMPWGHLGSCPGPPHQRLLVSWVVPRRRASHVGGHPLTHSSALRHGNLAEPETPASFPEPLSSRRWPPPARQRPSYRVLQLSHRHQEDAPVRYPGSGSRFRESRRRPPAGNCNPGIWVPDSCGCRDPSACSLARLRRSCIPTPTPLGLLSWSW